MTRPEPLLRGETPSAIKKAALRLFAFRGVDGVTVRDIAQASGQRNHASVSYYFGSKDNLVRELIIDGAALIDQRRHEALAKLESNPASVSIRSVVRIIVNSSVDISESLDFDEHYVRFLVMLNMTHREFFYDTLGEQWNTGYQRCLGLLRTLMPPMPLAAKNQRLLFMGASVRSVLAMRETILAESSRPHPTWRSPATLEHFVQLAAAMLEAPYEGDNPTA